jgi:hypothetical protein
MAASVAAKAASIAVEDSGSVAALLVSAIGAGNVAGITAEGVVVVVVVVVAWQNLAAVSLSAVIGVEKVFVEYAVVVTVAVWVN